MVSMVARILVHALCGGGGGGGGADVRNYVPALPIRDCRLAYRVPYAARWWNTTRSDEWRTAPAANASAGQ